MRCNLSLSSVDHLFGDRAIVFVEAERIKRGLPVIKRGALQK
jgi:hypothetical protein